MDGKAKNATALMKFPILGPVLNGQVPNNRSLEKLPGSSSPIDMPYYGMQNYSYRALESWL